MKKCIVMFSGGLDSVIATHLLLQQGLDVTALYFVLPFVSGLGFSHETIERYAAQYPVPLRIEEEADEFLAMVADPRFGYGKNANPCIDCRIHRLQKAKKIMEQIGASFIATGEVIGQRPMSQRRDTLYIIEKKAGLKGILLRPLSAQLLQPTIPELEGWVDRTTLLGISGRGRKKQLAYARQNGLQHGAPAGGCVLTEEEVAQRFMDLKEHGNDIGLHDFKLLPYGRHFRFSPTARLIVGRFAEENDIIEQLVDGSDHIFAMAETTGPFGLGKGDFSPDDIQTAAALLARYSRERDREYSVVNVTYAGSVERLAVKPADDHLCDVLRIAEVGK